MSKRRHFIFFTGLLLLQLLFAVFDSPTIIVHAQTTQGTSSSSSSSSIMSASASSSSLPVVSETTATSTSTSSIIMSTTTTPSTTTTTTLVPSKPNRTITRSVTRSQSTVCGVFRLFFGVPFFTNTNISLKQGVAQESFTLPLFLTLVSFVDPTGQIIFQQPHFYETTFFDQDPETLTNAISLHQGHASLSITHARRRVQWHKDLVVTWTFRPPRDMLEDLEIDALVDKSALACELTWGQKVPVAHVVLSRRYEVAQVFFVRGLLTLGDVVAVLTAPSSICMIAHALQRASILSAFFLCEIPNDYWFRFQFNPFRMEVGEYAAARPRGAVLGNMLFLLFMAFFVQFLAFCVTLWRRRKTLKWTWAKVLTPPDPEFPYNNLPCVARIKRQLRDYHAWYIPAKSLTKVRWPGILFIPFSFVAFGTSQGATELLRRTVHFGDVVLGLLGFIVLFAGMFQTWLILRLVMFRSVSRVVTVPEKDLKLETRFDRLCEFVRYQCFRFTTGNASYFDRFPDSAKHKNFVVKYGSCFDAFHTDGGFYWGLIDVVTSVLLGIIVGAHPRLNSVGCAVALLFISVFLAIYTCVLCLVRPWSTVHNRLFALTFALCNAAGAAINLFGTYTQKREYQNNADSLELATNGIALIKIFFDLVSLLLMPSLSGFLGYMLGSTGYRMMRHVAWEAEMKRREDVARALADEAAEALADEEAEEEEEDEDEGEKEGEGRSSAVVVPSAEPAQQEEQEGEEMTEKQQEEQEINRKPGVRYKVIRKFRVVKKKGISLPPGEEEDDDDDDGELEGEHELPLRGKRKRKHQEEEEEEYEDKTPTGTPRGSDDDEERTSVTYSQHYGYSPPSHLAADDDDEDGDENKQEEEGAEQPQQNQQQQQQPQHRPQQQIQPHVHKSGMTSLQRFMMI